MCEAILPPHHNIVSRGLLHGLLWERGLKRRNITIISRHISPKAYNLRLISLHDTGWSCQS